MQVIISGAKRGLPDRYCPLGWVSHDNVKETPLLAWKGLESEVQVVVAAAVVVVVVVSLPYSYPY